MLVLGLRDLQDHLTSCCNTNLCQAQKLLSSWRRSVRLAIPEVFLWALLKNQASVGQKEKKGKHENWWCFRDDEDQTVVPVQITAKPSQCQICLPFCSKYSCLISLSYLIKSLSSSLFPCLACTLKFLSLSSVLRSWCNISSAVFQACSIP